MAKRDRTALPTPLSPEQLQDLDGLHQAAVSGHGSGVLKHDGTDHLTLYYALERLDMDDRPGFVTAIIDSVVDEMGRDWVGHPDLDLDWLEGQEDRLSMTDEDVEAEAIDHAYEVWREQEYA